MGGTCPSSPPTRCNRSYNEQNFLDQIHSCVDNTFPLHRDFINRKVHSPSNKGGLKMYPLYLGLLLRPSKPTKMQKGENMRSSKLHSSWELTTFTTHWTHFGPQHLLGPLQHLTLKCLLFSVTLFLSHALIREGLVRTFRICLILNPRLLTCTPKLHFTAAFYADKWVKQPWCK